jgi:hypothetical protein
MQVQRGEVNLAAGVGFTVVTLPTPVPEGQSWAMASSRSNDSRFSRSICTALLQTVVEGNYTELRLERGSGVGVSTDTAWQVVTGPDFSVQILTGTITATNQTVTPPVSGVNVGSSFLVTGSRSEQAGGGRTFVRGRIVTSTSVEFRREDANNDGSYVAYLVEWTGATVQSDLVELSGTSATDAISSVDLDKSFALHSWSTSSNDRGARVIVECDIQDATTIRFQRGDDNASCFMSYFVVTHPDIVVQHESGTSAGSLIALPITAVDTSKTFLALGCNTGNTRTNHNVTATQHMGWATHVLADAETVDITRGNDADSFWGTAMVVSDAPSGLTPAVISLASVSDTEVAIDIDSHDATAAQHDMLRWDADPGAEPNPATADDTFADHNPATQFVDSTVAADTTYWYGLLSYEEAPV